MNYAQNGRREEDEDDGGRRWIVRGNPSTQIDSIVDNIIGYMLFF
jgi:hypothetical protein